MRFCEGRQGGRRVRVIASAAEGIGSNPIRGISFLLPHLPCKDEL